MASGSTLDIMTFVPDGERKKLNAEWENRDGKEGCPAGVRPDGAWIEGGCEANASSSLFTSKIEISLLVIAISSLSFCRVAASDELVFQALATPKSCPKTEISCFSEIVDASSFSYGFADVGSLRCREADMMSRNLN